LLRVSCSLLLSRQEPTERRKQATQEHDADVGNHPPSEIAGFPGIPQVEKSEPPRCYAECDQNPARESLPVHGNPFTPRIREDLSFPVDVRLPPRGLLKSLILSSFKEDLKRVDEVDVAKAYHHEGNCHPQKPGGICPLSRSYKGDNHASDYRRNQAKAHLDNPFLGRFRPA